MDIKMSNVSPQTRPAPRLIIGLVDADLLDGGTRHPNLALLKLAGFLHDQGIAFELIDSDEINPRRYRYIYISKVFSFTRNPAFFDEEAERKKGRRSKFRWGGTGFYATVEDDVCFTRARTDDMARLENDEFLNRYPNRLGGKAMGISMARQMPYYDLYIPYIEKRIAAGRYRAYFKDYLKFSIGFLTRGCFRQCPFCVNRLENRVIPYSKLEYFMDNERDGKGRLKRPYINLWDDNFLASPPRVWRPLLDELIATRRPFQFRQGLDERMIAESPYGTEIAEKLSQCRYHGDYIFAFDNWSDRDKIVKALKIWKKYNNKTTKFYLFCGFRLAKGDDERLYRDVWEIFQRIKILMQYGCLGYVMRHEDYHKHELNNIYVQIARWCNQPGFYKKMSFWDFCYRNQTFWEQRTLGRDVVDLKTYEEFLVDYNAGYYNDVKIQRPLKTLLSFIERFRDRQDELMEMINYRFSDLINPQLWNG